MKMSYGGRWIRNSHSRPTFILGKDIQNCRLSLYRSIVDKKYLVDSLFAKEKAVPYLWNNRTKTYRTKNHYKGG